MTVRELHAELTRRIVENPEVAEYEVRGEEEDGFSSRLDKMVTQGDKFIITFY